MAFTYTKTTDPVEFIGRKKISYGTYTSSGGGTGGDIDTGLEVCENLQLQPKGSAVVANQPAVNEDMPIAGSAVTIVTTADEVGTWIALGY